jgi:hypothetical protein
MSLSASLNLLLGSVSLAIGTVMLRRPDRVRNWELRVNRHLPRALRFTPDLKPPQVFGWFGVAVGVFVLGSFLLHWIFGTP